MGRHCPTCCGMRPCAKDGGAVAEAARTSGARASDPFTSAYWLWQGGGTQLDIGVEPSPTYIPPDCRSSESCAQGHALLTKHSPVRFNSTYDGVFLPGGVVGFHGYFNETVIGTTAPGLTADRVFTELRHRPTPAARARQPVITGGRTFIPLLGTVRHIVAVEDRVVVNITEQSHALAPGVVVRFVLVRGRTIFIGTFGEGMGTLPVLNGLLAPSTWRSVDEEIAKQLNR